MIAEQKGFSLIEVLVGLIFLAVGLLAIAGLHATSVRGNFFSDQLTQATYVAQSRLEFLRNLPFTSPELQAGDHNPDPVTISGVLFRQSYTVVANGDLKTIHCTVTWDVGINHKITLSTIQSK